MKTILKIILILIIIKHLGLSSYAFCQENDSSHFENSQDSESIIYPFNINTDSIKRSAEIIFDDGKNIAEVIKHGTLALNSPSLANQIFADILLTKASSAIELKILEGEFDADNPLIKVFIDTLAAYKYLISVPVSDTRKLITNLKEGNFIYIIDRLQNCIKSNKKYLITMISFILLAIYTYFHIRFKNQFPIK